MKMQSKVLLVIGAAVVCAMVSTDAFAQRRGGGSSGGGRSSGGSAVPRSGGVVRGGGPRGGVAAPRVGARVVSPRVVGRAPLRSYYYPYYSYRPGFSLGIYAGYPFYGYSYGYYPYGYRAYGYPGYYAYPGYGYGYGAPGYAIRSGYGAVRIEDAPEDAQVYVDGYYTGIVDDFDGAFQSLDLTPGAHEIEIRIPGQQPRVYDVNVTPGRTLNLHVR